MGRLFFTLTFLALLGFGPSQSPAGGEGGEPQWGHEQAEGHEASRLLGLELTLPVPSRDPALRTPGRTPSGSVRGAGARAPSPSTIRSTFTLGGGHRKVQGEGRSLLLQASHLARPPPHLSEDS